VVGAALFSGAVNPSEKEKKPSRAFFPPPPPMMKMQKKLKRCEDSEK